MQIGLDLLQTIAILVTLLFSLWQWKETRNAIKVDNYSRLIGSLNDLRKERLARPRLEGLLFESRKEWDEDKISQRIYAVMMANVLELALFSHEAGLIDEKHWEDWASMWKKVILPEKNFAALMLDETVYTFDLGAHEQVKAWMEEVSGAARQPKPPRS
jgi:hypothetical protein